MYATAARSEGAVLLPAVCLLQPDETATSEARAVHPHDPQTRAPSLLSATIAGGRSSLARKRIPWQQKIDRATGERVERRKQRVGIARGVMRYRRRNL
ncbi:hypothetical protein IE81DRAFT_324062 [Ceraceosorus guamensis]|uniref:Uncharacterized protein n=1 Tax=Ceraceosorus guamensis TaxID=1522189 RepID=A0A316VWP4_9BASI|nr:hypothetical protein IE81DRAFT_324062 [Ceraceosorus guamensis]PWN41890.1 hypothetical protein IE81DRAFT_324062 [Ceraceosorus guamensis]